MPDHTPGPEESRIMAQIAREEAATNTHLAHESRHMPELTALREVGLDVEDYKNAPGGAGCLYDVIDRASKGHGIEM